MLDGARLKIGIVGTGISGLSAAWLLNKSHDVTIFEQDERLGGHSNTVDVDLTGPFGHLRTPVDTGFIVYNERTYPNLTALFDYLDVPTEKSVMSFSASVNAGRFEYSGSGIRGLLAQKRNLVRPRFWSMVLDLLRFYRECVADAHMPENASLSLGDYLKKSGYSDGFLRDHIYPMASSIWSATFEEIRAYPLAAFVRFFSNHGLLETKAHKRPQWRTVSGGSRSYVELISAEYSNRILLNSKVIDVTRASDGVTLKTESGEEHQFDHVIIAAHSTQAISMLSNPSEEERALLNAIRYEKNTAFLHTDSSMMPKRRNAWASWNYLSDNQDDREKLVCLTYWMNLLQNIDKDYPVFVTLNPHRNPDPSKTIKTFEYEHPIFDQKALDAQQKLWALQGTNRTWFCGAYFGYGFHEDGLQSGLAVAESLGGVKRPWSVEDESGRICMTEALPNHVQATAA